MQYIKHQNKSLIHSNSLLIFRLPTEMLMVSHDVKLRANYALTSWYFKSIVCLIIRCEVQKGLVFLCAMTFWIIQSFSRCVYPKHLIYINVRHRLVLQHFLYCIIIIININSRNKKTTPLLKCHFVSNFNLFQPLSWFGFQYSSYHVQHN